MIKTRCQLFLEGVEERLQKTLSSHRKTEISLLEEIVRVREEIEYLTRKAVVDEIINAPKKTGRKS